MLQCLVDLVLPPVGGEQRSARNLGGQEQRSLLSDHGSLGPSDKRDGIPPPGNEISDASDSTTPVQRIGPVLERRDLVSEGNQTLSHH